MQKLTASFVALPDGVKFSLTAVVLWAVSLLFTNAILLVPFLAFLEAFKVPITQAIAAALIALIEKSVPDAYAPVAIKALELVLLVLAAFGVGATLAAQGALPALLS